MMKVEWGGNFDTGEITASINKVQVLSEKLEEINQNSDIFQPDLAYNLAKSIELAYVAGRNDMHREIINKIGE